MKKTLYFSSLEVIEKLESLSLVNKMSGYVNDLIVNDLHPKKEVVTREEVVSLIMSHLNAPRAVSQSSNELEDSINSVLQNL